MGKESFFVNLHLSGIHNYFELEQALKDSFTIAPYYLLQKGMLFTRHIRLNNKLVINSIIELSWDSSYTISMQGCFSCYKQALEIICEVVSLFKNKSNLIFIHYRDVVLPVDKVNDDLFQLLYDAYYEKYDSFRKAFSNIEESVLPGSYFYERYKKNNKSKPI